MAGQVNSDNFGTRHDGNEIDISKESWDHCQFRNVRISFGKNQLQTFYAKGTYFWTWKSYFTNGTLGIKSLKLIFFHTCLCISKSALISAFFRDIDHISIIYRSKVTPFSLVIWIVIEFNISDDLVERCNFWSVGDKIMFDISPNRYFKRRFREISNIILITDDSKVVGVNVICTPVTYVNRG